MHTAFDCFFVKVKVINLSKRSSTSWLELSENVYDFDAIIRKVNENVNSKVSAISSINDIKSKYQDKVQYLVISENDGNINRNDTLVVSKNIPDFLLKSNITDLHGAFQKKCKSDVRKTWCFFNSIFQIKK